eukprot:SAG11_NODE_1956_length_4002_cov_5.858827_3_plen_164_part_00
MPAHIGCARTAPASDARLRVGLCLLLRAGGEQLWQNFCQRYPRVFQHTRTSTHTHVTRTIVDIMLARERWVPQCGDDCCSLVRQSPPTAVRRICGCAVTSRCAYHLAREPRACAWEASGAVGQRDVLHSSTTLSSTKYAMKILARIELTWAAMMMTQVAWCSC